MAFRFSSFGINDLLLTNDDYGKLISFYQLENETVNKVQRELKKKYLTGELQKTVNDLKVY